MAAVESFDHGVVGAGSAGSVLAHRLGEDPDVRILVLEAGGHDRSPIIEIPLTWGPDPEASDVRLGLFHRT